MRVETEVWRSAGWAVVAVRGELDLATAPALRRRVVDLVAGGEVRIVVDLTATDFMDSVGLGMLVAALKRVRSAGGELRVVCPEPRLRRLFELTGLEGVLSIADEVDLLDDEARVAQGSDESAER